MYIEDTGIENIVADLSILDEIMLKHDLVRAGQWDYERATFRQKIYDQRRYILFARIQLYY